MYSPKSTFRFTEFSEALARKRCALHAVYLHFPHHHDEQEWHMDEWHDFFLAQAGAAGALTLLVGVLTASVLLLVPGQGQVMVGSEVLVVGLATWGCVVAIQLLRLRSWGTMRPDLRQVFVLRIALGQIATLPLVIASVAVLAGDWEGSTGWWRARSSRSSWLCSTRGCCSSRSTARSRPGLPTALCTLVRRR